MEMYHVEKGITSKTKGCQVIKEKAKKKKKTTNTYKLDSGLYIVRRSKRHPKNILPAEF